ncbi:voltage-dependent calcium channel subunit alpha-2/delta-1-like [Notothenia coriiceps]|uniref:Voltage-dependent calcium channel subunit alpha-2/delta-1-like n=1 Tax=Notothenia coriiceps TaxID=8208 RepID=A0A6I9NXD3_9TELE|nr:PREDICTED: voltage-dependent calcium channel subunit alpha-2/delta-1-like [Notothenia coriiceps]
MDTCRVRSWVFLVLLWQDGSLASQFPTQLMIKEWVDQMQKELVTLADTATAGKSLTEIFLQNQHLYTVEQNDAEELVARAATKIEQLLRKRSAALEQRFTKRPSLPTRHVDEILRPSKTAPPNSDFWELSFGLGRADSG